MLYCLHRHAAGFSMLLSPPSLLVLCLNHCSHPQLRKGGHVSEHKQQTGFASKGHQSLLLLGLCCGTKLLWWRHPMQKGCRKTA